MPFRRSMYSTAVGMVRDKEDALDVMQDALMSLWRGRKHLRDAESVESYCVAAVRNCALAFLRKNDIPKSDINFQIESLSDIDRSIEHKELLEELGRAISSLNSTQRRILELHSFSGLSHDEISKVTGDSPGNVRTILSRARKALRDSLKLK